LVAAASPGYLERFGAPATPHDLRHHRCVCIRLGNDQLFQWAFERGPEAVAIATPGPLTVDESHAAIGFGLGGIGIIYGAEPVLRPHLNSGDSRIVMGDWAPMGSGFHVSCSGRRQVPTALRLLIELIREMHPPESDGKDPLLQSQARISHRSPSGILLTTPRRG